METAKITGKNRKNEASFIGIKFKFVAYIILIFCTKMYAQEYNSLTQEEKQVILYKGTEAPFTGEYNDFKAEGLFVCRQCDHPLYFSKDKFDSGCGWPSFEDEIEDSVRRLPDADGRRTEIICNRCQGHLGHVFLGEKLTAKDTRHCVNSLSIKFIPQEKVTLEIAIFAAGCFWGVEHYFSKIEGVISTRVGYTGGKTDAPSYNAVCLGDTEHAEAIEVIFDNTKISYQSLCKLFFEIHDPTQLNRQGPDVGTQYRSEIFYTNKSQKQTAEELIDILKQKGYDVKTALNRATTFWKAEDYHQDYYEKTQKSPYCHFYTKRF